MALFRKSNDAESTPAPAPEPEVDASASRKKGTPTPSRREAEAARMQRLHPELDPKQAKKADREARNAQRARDMNRMEATPERQLVRDVVDARWNIGEIVLPLMMVMILLTLIPQRAIMEIVATALMLFIIVAMTVDSVWVWSRIKKVADRRLPGTPMKKRGLAYYMWNRQMQFRRWRNPAPRVTIGQDIDELPLGR